MSSIFSKIIKGDIPSYKIAENEHFYAFLDIFPLRHGHVLIVPKEETDKFFDVSDVFLAEWLLFAKPIAIIIMPRTSRTNKSRKRSKTIVAKTAERLIETPRAT